MVFPSSVKMGFGGEWDLHQKTQKLKTHPKFGFREGSIVCKPTAKTLFPYKNGIRVVAIISHRNDMMPMQ